MAVGSSGRLAKAATKVPRWVVRASAVIGPLGALAALLIGIRDLGNLSGPAWAVALAISGVAIVVVAITTIYLQQYRHEWELNLVRSNAQQELDLFRRNAQAAITLPAIHDAYHDLRDAWYAVASKDSEESQVHFLTQSLNQMATAFSVITGSPCRMCVKRLAAREDAPTEVTLSNEDAGEEFFNVSTVYRHDGRHNATKDGPTPLFRNSDFREIWSPTSVSRCFFSNDLNATPGYLNDHRTGDPSTYEYNAAIVWPIQKRKHDGHVDLVGYLCVDTLQKNVFQYDNDFYLGAAYADSLYMVLAMRRQLALDRTGGVEMLPAGTTGPTTTTEEAE